MKLVVLFLLCEISPLVLAYRDGARENSCYNHSIDHGEGTGTFLCEPPQCPFFLRIREVVNDTTLELYNETTNTYQCGRIYGIELANSLNDPEGFLIQARNGTDTSSEIIGTFLDPVVVRDILAVGDTAPQVNYKILSCNRSISDTDSQVEPNSATHPMTVDMASVLQLYWQAPDCSTCGLGDLRIWFTAVQQLQIVFATSKVTELQLNNYAEPENCVPTTAPPTTTSPPTTTLLSTTTMPPTTTTLSTTTMPPTTTTLSTTTMPPTTTTLSTTTMPPSLMSTRINVESNPPTRINVEPNLTTSKAAQPLSKCGILFLFHFIILSVLLIFS